MEWLAFQQLEGPIGSARDDLHAAQTTHAVRIIEALVRTWMNPRGHARMPDFGDSILRFDRGMTEEHKVRSVAKVKAAQRVWEQRQERLRGRRSKHSAQPHS